jgi:hypothetical protein
MEVDPLCEHLAVCILELPAIELGHDLEAEYCMQRIPDTIVVRVYPKLTNYIP